MCHGRRLTLQGWLLDCLIFTKVQANFEEETVGKLLAVGDIKAVWARCFGAPSMEDILRHNKNDWMLSH